MFSISVGINVTMLISAACYFLLYLDKLGAIVGTDPAARSGSIKFCAHVPGKRICPGL